MGRPGSGAGAAAPPQPPAAPAASAFLGAPFLWLLPLRLAYLRLGVWGSGGLGCPERAPGCLLLEPVPVPGGSNESIKGKFWLPAMISVALLTPALLNDDMS